MLGLLVRRVELKSPGEVFTVSWLSIVWILSVVLIHLLWFCEVLHSLHTIV